MIVLSIIYLIASNAATLRRDKSILYARTAIVIILCSFILNINTYYNEFFDNPIGLFGGLYEITANTHIFHMFMFIITGIILLLNSFYPRKVYFEEINWVFGLQPSVYNNSFIVNKMSEQFRLIEYSLVILFIVIGGIFLICSSDLISLFLSIELQSYGLYILCAIYRNSEKAIGGALMYFLLGGLSSCFILLSSALLYGNTGNTSFDGLYILNDICNTSEGNIYNYYFINMSLIILIVGLLFKISAAPFHFWSPDVYDSVPTIVTTFIAVFTKISILILMLIIVTNINKYTYTNDLDINQQINQSLNNSWILVLLVSSLLSLIIGSILGLTQFRVKRLYAYSTISHLGFILLALVVNTIESTQSFIFYVMQYSITNLNAFFLLVTIGYSLYIYVEKETKTGNERTHNSDKNDSPLQLINQLKGYFYINPLLALSLALTLFSFAGIPPLIGFFGKQMVLSSALDNGYVFITFIAILTSVVSAYYYLAIIKNMFFEKSNYIVNSTLNNVDFKIKTGNTKNTSFNTENIKLSGSLSLSIAILTLIILLFILSPEEWLNMTNILSIIIYNS